ncbi:uncharacterized protein LOC117303134 [Asterias rubens]|uniref:uncharacterized protein LOC117303134 n=1 Tax=Asterias rubens TaxID=7604 RepID=UPI001455A10D|nr:uncharacterized protein LOC117303134 [Asterias rubens]
MGCSATKTVPQEHPTPDKGRNNVDILRKDKDTGVRSPKSSSENGRKTPETYNSQNGGQTGGQTGGHTGEQTSKEDINKLPSELNASKDLGNRKLQRKETPISGPLAPNKAISQSQMEFFKLLDEKIERGVELPEDDDVT